MGARCAGHQHPRRFGRPGRVWALRARERWQVPPRLPRIVALRDRGRWYRLRAEERGGRGEGLDLGRWWFQRPLLGTGLSARSHFGVHQGCRRSLQVTQELVFQRQGSRLSRCFCIGRLSESVLRRRFLGCRLAGIFARLNALRTQQGMPPLGFLNPFIYKNRDAFNDVVQGKNSDSGPEGFEAMQGWDPATGFGTPNFPKLKKAALAASPSMVSPSQTFVV